MCMKSHTDVRSSQKRAQAIPNKMEEDFTDFIQSAHSLLSSVSPTLLSIQITLTMPALVPDPLIGREQDD